MTDEADKVPLPSDRADAAAVACLRIFAEWRAGTQAPAELHRRLAAYLDGVVGQ
jgi:hypothetical protein